MQEQVVWIVAVLGAGALVGAFWKMKGGFGPFNLRVVGIVLIATFAALLALVKDGSLNGSIGILGAIAGYLFSIRGSST